MAKPVLISGAGLGGLLLARSLRSSNIPYFLYERDQSIKARAQGYRIRISSDGLGALREVLSDSQYAHFLTGTATTGGGGIHGLDAITGEELDFAPGGGPSNLGGDVLGVARGWLRQCLFDDMEDQVSWAKQTVGYTETDSGVTLKFADGTTSPEGSLIIAADSIHSAITKKLTDGKVRAFDTGARMVHGQSPASAFRQLGEGVWSVHDKTRPAGNMSLITNVRPGELEKDVEFGWVFVGGPGVFALPEDKYSETGKIAADLSRELTAQWHERFQPIFRDQNDAEAAFLKMSTADPKGVPEWQNSTRVTLLGDAVHCMTPAGGVGANTALKDAAFLGRLLKEAGGWKAGITEQYEKEMRVYASENVKMSFESAAKRMKLIEPK